MAKRRANPPARGDSFRHTDLLAIVEHFKDLPDPLPLVDRKQPALGLGCRVRRRRFTNPKRARRRFTLSLLKQEQSKGSLKVKHKKTGWDNDFLLQLLVTHRE